MLSLFKKKKPRQFQFACPHCEKHYTVSLDPTDIKDFHSTYDSRDVHLLNEYQCQACQKSIILLFSEDQQLLAIDKHAYFHQSRTPQQDVTQKFQRDPGELSKKDLEMVTYLNQAIDDRRVLDIIYYGGEHPGANVRLFPVAIVDHELKAVCHQTNSVKLFDITRIRLPEALPNPSEVKGVEQRDSVTSAKDFFEPYEAELLKLGWYVELSETRISVWGRAENRLTDQTPDIELKFKDENPFRPWYVYDQTWAKARTYLNINSAATQFLEQARLGPRPD
ncbi:MAG: hypothetical protein JRE63_04165 [Deltaproteobacteria bacterium]|jgi:hypothetical protein|nr:hypothetical protein [Deltaproteobacteria bacterium]